MIKLNYRVFGEGEPLIILHGLYGSSDNWAGIARKLQNQFKVITVDLRNHGRSPHLNEHNYDVMSDDLLCLFKDLDIYSANLLGHSMGGKVALSFALFNPERVKRLIVVDISPRTYQIELGDSQFSEHEKILSAIKSINIAELRSRDEADELLSKYISNVRIRSFLLKNLYRNKEKEFKWRINIDVLVANLNEVLKGFEDSFIYFRNLDCPVLFIKGGISNYIQKKDVDMIKENFKRVEIKTINEASHWVHAENPDEFTTLVKEFCI